MAGHCAKAGSLSGSTVVVILDVNHLLQRLGQFTPEGWATVPLGVVLFTVSQGQDLIAQLVPQPFHAAVRDATTDAYVAALSDTSRGGARNGGAIDGVVPDPVGATPVHDDQPLDDTASSPSEHATTEAFFSAAFLVFAPAFSPEVVTVRLPGVPSVHHALTLVSAARSPLPRLRFPRLIPARMQTMPGVGIIIAAPTWPKSGVCVFFAFVPVDTWLFCVKVTQLLIPLVHAPLPVTELGDICFRTLLVGGRMFLSRLRHLTLCASCRTKDLSFALCCQGGAPSSV